MVHHHVGREGDARTAVANVRRIPGRTSERTWRTSAAGVRPAGETIRWTSSPSATVSTPSGATDATESSGSASRTS